MRLLSGPIVDIYVGDTKRHWPLHRNLLAYHSEYLKAELQHSPNDTPKRKTFLDNLRLDLPDDDPVGFELLVKWLYQGKIEEVSNILDHNDKYEHAVACQKLHQLCERLEFPRLKNMAMDQYRRALNEAGLVPDAEELNLIYRQSVEHSPFRKLMSHIAARQIMDPESDKDAEDYRICFEDNPDFAVDVINAVKKGMGGLLFDDPTEKQGCEYHDHSEGQNCHTRGKKKLDKHHPLLQTRDQTDTLRHRRRKSTASLKHTTDIQANTRREDKSPPPPGIPITMEEEEEQQQPNGLKEPTTDTVVKKKKTTFDPPSPEPDRPHHEADEAQLEDGASTRRSQGEERPASSHDGASVEKVVMNGERPKVRRSMSKKLIKRRSSKSIQSDKAVNPFWGWTRLGSGRSVASSTSAVANGSV